MLEEEVGWRVLFSLIEEEAVCDIASHGVTVDRDVELSWVVGVVVLGQGESSWPNSQGIRVYDDETEGKGAD